MINRKDLTKYIAAFTIGDGNLRKQGSNAIYRNAQVEQHKDYTDWQVSILSELTHVNMRYEIRDGRQPRWVFETRQHPMYTSVYDRMYIDGRKVIDPHYLTLFDWESLAVLHMDDGCLAKRYVAKYDRLDYNIIIATESFSYGDNLILSSAIKEKTDMAFDVVRQNVNGNLRYRLRLNKRQTPVFAEHVAEFLLPSFQYKVDLSNDKRPDITQADDIV